MNESVIKSINIRRNVEFQNLMMLHLRHKRSNYLETMQAYLYHNKDGMYKVPGPETPGGLCTSDSR